MHVKVLGALPFIYAFLFSAIQLPGGVNAIHPQVFSRQTTILNKPGTPQGLSLPLPSLQISSRDSSFGICASVDLGLLAELEPLLGFKLPDRVFTRSYYCLCMNDLDFYLDTNTDLTFLATLFGRDALLTYLQVLIKTSATRQECIQMPQVHNTCRNSDLRQKNGGLDRISITSMTNVGDSCVCTASLPSCNGVDGRFSEGCSSMVLDKSKDQGLEGLHATAAVETMCEAHETACRVSENEDTPSSACLNVATAGESCGGCLRPVSTNQPSETAGIDCRRIANVEKVDCVNGACIVQSCAVGWVPSTGGEACIQQSKKMILRMRRVKSRANDTPVVTLDIHVVIDLAQLWRSLHYLRLHSDNLRNSSTTEPSVPPIAIDDISQATGEIVMSRTLESFLARTRWLLALARRVDKVLSDCKYESQRFDSIKADIGAFMFLASDILDVSCAPSLDHGSPNNNSSETPIAVALDRLFDDLGLDDLGALIKTGELGSELTGNVDEPLDDPENGPNEEGRRGQLGGADALLARLQGLVALVLQLDNLGSVLSLRTSSPADSGVLAPVSLATLALMTSTRISEVSSRIDLLVLASSNARMALSSCSGCDDVVDKLSLIVRTAIAIKGSCGAFSPDEEIELPFPIPTPDSVPPHKTVSTSAARTSIADTIRPSKGAPVVIVLDGLLHSVGLRGASANVSIDGLDPGLSGMLNGVLSLLRASGKRPTRRGGDIDFSSAIFADPRLTKTFSTAVECVVDLESQSVRSGPLATLLAGLMPPVLASLQVVLGSPTVGELISAVDGLLGAAKTMDDTLTSCQCTSDPVLKSSRRFVAAVEDVRDWIGEHPDSMRLE